MNIKNIKSKKTLGIIVGVLLIYLVLTIDFAITFTLIFGGLAYSVVRAWYRKIQHQNATTTIKNPAAKIYVEAVVLSVTILCSIPWFMLFCLGGGLGLVFFMMVGYEGLDIGNASLATIPHLLMCMCYIAGIFYYLFPVACVFFWLKIICRKITSYYHVWLLLPLVITFIWLGAAALVVIQDKIMHHPNSAKVALWLENKLTALTPTFHTKPTTTNSTAALPAGNYNQSCLACEVRDTFLMCRCDDAAGNHVNSKLDLTKAHSPNTILQNCDGRLMYIDHC